MSQSVHVQLRSVVTLQETSHANIVRISSKFLTTREMDLGPGLNLTSEQLILGA
jgi:hypothetical protein